MQLRLRILLLKGFDSIVFFEINKNVATVSLSELLKLQIGAIKIVLLN